MKYSPKRTCVVCRKSQDKQDLIRVVEIDESIVIDINQKINSRGFYFCKNSECINSVAKKRVLSRVKKTNIASQKHESLQNLLNNFVNKE